MPVTETISRRQLLRVAGLGTVGLLAACQPKVIKETVVVKQEVEKVVKETVVVKEAIEVEKEVTRVVEKEVPVKAPREKVSLVFEHTHPRFVTFCENTVDPMFQDLHPEIEVKREFTPGYVNALYPKLAAMHVAGTPWDLAHCPARFGMEYEQYARGLMRDLEPFVNRDNYDLDQFYPIAVQACRFQGGALFLVPVVLSAGYNVMAYNRKLFQEAGVEEPNETWRYPMEFKQALIDLKEALNPGEQWDYYTWQWPGLGTPHSYQHAVDSWNGAILDPMGRTVMLDAPEAKASMKFHTELFRDKIATLEGDVAGGVGQAFSAGLVCMMTIWPTQVVMLTAEAEQTGLDVGFTLMPKGPEPDGKCGGHAHMHMMAMHSNADHPDEGWDYLKFYTSDEITKLQWQDKDLGEMGPKKKDWADPELVGIHPVLEKVRDLLDVVPMGAIPWNFRGIEMQDEITNGMTLVFREEIGFQEGLSKTCDAIRAILDKPMATRG